MPLGFEPNNGMAQIIQRGGEYLANQLVETGKQIEQSLIRGQTFREARDFGLQLSQINPASDDFPQAATALAARYPLAMASGLGKSLLEPAAQAYHGYQQGKQAQAIANRQTGLAGLNHRYRMSEIANRGPVPLGGAGDGSLAPLPTDDPLQSANPGPTLGSLATGGVSGFMGGAAPEAPATATDGSDPLNVNVTEAMRNREARSKTIPEYMQELKDENRQLQAQGLPPIWNDRNAAREATSRKKLADKQAEVSDAKSLEDFAATEGLTRIGDTNYFTRAGQGRYSITRNAKGQYTFKDAPVSAMPEKDGLKLAGTINESTQKDYKIQLAEAEKKAGEAERDWKAAQSAFEKVRKYEHADDEGQLAQFRELQKAAIDARNALGAARAARDAVKEPKKVEFFSSPEEARAAGKQSGDVIILINPDTGKPAQARLK